MKKVILGLVATLGLCGSVGLLQDKNSNEYSICQIEGCEEIESHGHDGEIYLGHHEDDGHAYHNCGVDGCNIIEKHTHSNNQHESEHGNRHNGGHH